MRHDCGLFHGSRKILPFPLDAACARWVDEARGLGSVTRSPDQLRLNHHRDHRRMAANDEKIWIGFDLGGTKMLSIAYDDQWKELGRRRRKTRGREGSDNGAERIASTISRLLDENDLSKSAIGGIGIGCPGPIDLDNGNILTTPNLGWDDVEIGKFLKKRFDCPEVVLNDVDAGVCGEYKFGSAKDSRC